MPNGCLEARSTKKPIPLLPNSPTAQRLVSWAKALDLFDCLLSWEDS